MKNSSIDKELDELLKKSSFTKERVVQTFLKDSNFTEVLKIQKTSSSRLERLAKKLLKKSFGTMILTLNEDLVGVLLRKKVLDFENLLKALQRTQRLYLFIAQNQVVELYQNKVLRLVDLKKILDYVKYDYELQRLMANLELFQVLLRAGAFQKHLDRFDEIVESNSEYFLGTRTYFDFATKCIDENWTILGQSKSSALKIDELNDLKLRIYCVQYSQRLKLNKILQNELFKLLQSDEAAHSKLDYVLENRLEASFETFEELKTYLAKPEKKQTLGI